MGFCSSVTAISIVRHVGILLGLVVITGCQMPQPGLSNRFANHVAMVNSSGLHSAETLSDLDVRVSLPDGWEAMETQSSAIFTHQQWRSHSHATGIGVAYIHMPLPMSAKALVWFARSRYSEQNARDHKPDPQMMGEWSDSLGREWFEGANEKYHVKGYVLTHGFDAWVVYAGYRVKMPPKADEISLAFRSMDSIVPVPLEKEELAVSVRGGGNR